MSTSMLYHTFGVLGVQYKKAVFLAERPFFTAAATGRPGSRGDAEEDASEERRGYAKCGLADDEWAKGLGIFHGDTAKTGDL